MTGPQDPSQPDPSEWEAVVPPPPAPPYYAATQPAATPAVKLVDEQRRQRFEVRPLPQLGGSIAAAGIGLGVFGIVIWAGEYATSGNSGSPFGGGGGSRSWLGTILAIIATLVGYVLAGTARRGPLATAGVCASALGVPVALAFLTFGNGGDGTPFSLDVVVLVSVAVWLLSYYFLPGVRGHALYVGLSAFVLWIYLLDKVSPRAFLLPFEAAIRINGTSPFGDSGDINGDLTSLAAMSLVTGAVYYLLAFVLDSRGLKGAAVPFALAGFPAVAVGLAFAANDLGEAGTGLVLIPVGLLLAAYGALAGRRFTTWVWAAGSALGVELIVAKASPDNTAAAGVTFLIVGALFVGVGIALSRATGEREYPGS